MTIEELKQKIWCFTKALQANEETTDNKIFADVAQTSLIKLQAELIAKLEGDEMDSTCSTE